MKRIVIMPLVALTFLLPLLLLSACGGGGGGEGGGDSSASSGSSSSGPVATTLAGRVADGYLVDAKVFLDRNNNRTYDNGEPTVQTTAGGVYELSVNPGDGEMFPVVVQVIAGKTVDADTNLPVDKGYSLESLPGHWEFVSPLTTMVALESGKSQILGLQQTPQQIENIVRQRLGVSAVSFYTDYVAASSGDDAAQDYQRAHRIARVVAGIMGTVQNTVEQIPGVAESSVMAFMISDQVLAQDHLIRKVLNVDQNVTDLITTIVAGIDTGVLDVNLLERYIQQVATPPASEGWDMQPPRPESKFPAPDNTASIDTIISITFDENLVSETDFEDSIEVFGPQGAVAGNVDYDESSWRLTFTPADVLIAFSDYHVVVRAGLTDVSANPLGADIVWDFSTIFDLLPPVLPSFQ